MSIDLFDVQAGILGATPAKRDVVAADDLLAEMARLQIARALVRVAPVDLEFDLPFCNRKLYDACAGSDKLVPCPAVAPNTGGDLPDERQQVDEAIRQGAGAVCIRPAADCWLIADWLSDRLFEALVERRMPLYVSKAALPPTELAELAGRFAELPILYAELDYRHQRILLPLLERFANVHLSIGNNFTVHRGIEQFVERLGPGRLLFGTGFPDAEPMGAAMQLLYADVADAAKRQIGSENMERLMEGIRT